MNPVSSNHVYQSDTHLTQPNSATAAGKYKQQAVSPLPPVDNLLKTSNRASQQDGNPVRYGASILTRAAYLATSVAALIGQKTLAAGTTLLSLAHAIASDPGTRVCFFKGGDEVRLNCYCASSPPELPDINLIMTSSETPTETLTQTYTEAPAENQIIKIILGSVSGALAVVGIAAYCVYKKCNASPEGSQLILMQIPMQTLPAKLDASRQGTVYTAEELEAR